VGIKVSALLVADEDPGRGLQLLISDKLAGHIAVFFWCMVGLSVSAAKRRSYRQASHPID